MKNIFLLLMTCSVVYFCSAADNCNNPSFIMRARTPHGVYEYEVPQNRIESIRGQLMEFNCQVQGNAFAIIDILNIENRSRLSSGQVTSTHFPQLIKNLYPNNQRACSYASNAPRKN